ncbi:guanine nucleotide-releasing factor 2-like [Rhopilema esculentum]|uniref:guanine nucleotide-releasing factor 2-like n=1 Tax=Rhopilema esculentum TaxID=499914 RepID=UPI0031D633DC|eukprot:gene14201-5209_t
MATTFDGSTKNNADKSIFIKTLKDPHIHRMQGLLKKIKKSTLSRPKTIVTQEDKHVASPVNSKTPTAKQSTETDEEKLLRYQKDIKSALQYYKVIFDKKFPEKLPGTATVVLESIVSIETIFNACLHYSKLVNESFDDLEPTRETLHRNVTNLIRLSDDVLFDSSSNFLPDKNDAFRAVDSVLQSLNNLCEAILPRLQKLQVNEELKSYCRSNSTHSSSNSLDDLLDSQDEGTPGRKSRKTSSSSSQFAVNGSASLSDRPASQRSTERDSGFASEMSNVSLTAENRTDDVAPAKPPLPRKEDRSYYGNQPFPGQSHIRKTSSNPVTLETPFSPVHLRPRPSSDFRSGSNHSGQFLDVNKQYSSFSTSVSSLNSSKSSFSSVEDSTAISPRRKYLLRRSYLSEASRDSTDSIAEQIDLDQVGMRDEFYAQIQKCSERYEVLYGSHLSLFPTDNDEEDIFGTDKPARDSLPPVPPKQRNKKSMSNYLKYFDIDKYGKPSKGDRPASYYDNVNCPVPSAYNINGEQFIKALGNNEEPPKLPPKKGTYRRKTINHGHSTSPKLRSDRLSTRSFKADSRGSHRELRRRESTATYEEDNVPALDCTDVRKFLISKDDRNGPLLVGGTVDGLLVFATEAEVKNNIFYEAFIATYRTFMSPVDLICKLLYRANRFRDKGESYASHGALSLLIRIIDEMYEELDKSLFDQLRAEVHRLLNRGELEVAKLLRDKIVNYCLKLQEKLQTKSIITLEVGSKYSLLDFPSLELAQQMTLVDSELFMKIGLAEILAWGKEQNELVSPNLAEFIEHFNKMSYWCRTLILKEAKQQEREKLYKKFLKVMKHCRRLNNFSSYLAILSALDCSPLRRLEFPKPLTDLLQEFNLLIDSASAFKTYRQALSEAKPPCIPYLGLILQDITFIHLGNPNELPDGKVNFVKRWQQFNVLDSVRRLKECQYDFSKNDNIMDFFSGYDEYLSEEELWEKSQELKPRKKA